MDSETSFKIRFALAEAFGADFAESALADELCAFGERYGLERVRELLESAEADLGLLFIAGG